MKRFFQGVALMGLALILVAGSATAGEGTWVSDKGKVHAIHSGNAVFVSDDGAEKFNLSDLRDGESRTFGTGDKAVTVSRRGDEATISRASSGDDVSAIDVLCRLDEDNCTVLTFANDADKVMVAIEKERTCVNGEGDCDFALGQAHGMGHVVVDIDCDGDDCEDLHTMQLSELSNTFTVETAGDGSESSRIVIRRVGDAAAKAENVFVTKMGASGMGELHEFRALHGDSVMLTCSEGDATIMVKKEEKDDTFLCPKHSTPMEASKGDGNFHVIRGGKPHEH
jgi:hypothetical protein